MLSYLELGALSGVKTMLELQKYSAWPNVKNEIDCVYIMDWSYAPSRVVVRNELWCYDLEIL